ncbi:hypothetical protein EH243_08095 [Amphritea opalescens]|uniref:Uncharacterized protein n=1 Tax=Amphritea opalescens TaxID=2490544 RepID=A0A430KRV9_9GAMM|nr:hypothetical protein [Amphritea opalescens]RTE66074.1 hypothetical protein EH243_08095 [Amphritea opalescens]
MVTWLISVTGKDRPEQLYKFCETIALMEGVFLDNRQTVIDGRVFATYKICFPALHIVFIRKMFAEFELKGLRVFIFDELSLKEADRSNRGGYLILDLQGQYRFGIDHDVRMILESHGGIIEQLNQHYLGDAVLGESQFNSRIRARLSRSISEDDLLQALYRLSPSLSIQLNVFETANVLAC